MSSYQLYEFQSLDHSLSDADQTFLQSLSSRAELTATSAPLEQFADIFEISPDLLAAAALRSETVAISSAEPIETWIAALPESVRNQYLLRVAKGETHVGLELMQYLRQQFGTQPNVLAGQSGSRTFAELEVAATQKSDERSCQEKAEAEIAEQQRIESLIPQVDTLWQLVQHLIERGQAKPYDEAVAHLVDLQAIAKMQGETAVFDNRIQVIEEAFKRKRSFISRLQNAGLL